MTHRQDEGQALYPEVTATVQFLGRCPSCGSPHPLALRPPRRDNTCGGCGITRDAPPAPVTVDGATSDARIRLGLLLAGIGKRLHQFSKRL